MENLENQSKIERLQQELNTANANFQRENRTRIDCERNIQDLEGRLKDKFKENNHLTSELDSQRLRNDRLTEDNTRLYNEGERQKQHISVLTEQNARVFIFRINLSYLMRLNS